MKKTGFLHMRKQRHTCRSADQRLRFCSIDSTTPLLPETLAICCACAAQFVSDLVGIPDERFSYDETKISLGSKCFSLCMKNLMFLAWVSRKFSENCSDWAYVSADPSLCYANIPHCLFVKVELNYLCFFI